MRNTMETRYGLWIIGAMALVAGTSSAARTGEKAPDFTGRSYEGKTVKLSDLRGKYVVLEWHNQGCPYVKKYYNSGAMQKLQSEWTKRGVTWLTVISSAPGKQGYVTAAQEKAYLKEKKASPTDVLFDSDAKIAKAYGAKTTPHMFVIDPKGVLIYDGAIDDKPTTDRADLAGAKNYVAAALTDAMAGRSPAVASTPPYGCSVKYQ